MQIDVKWLVVVAAVASGLTAGGFMLGMQAGAERATARAPAAAPPAPPQQPAAAPAPQPATTAATPAAGSAGPLPEGAPVPSNHPPMPTPAQLASAPAGHPPMPEAAAINTDVTFTHFRVGNRNIKALLPDGDLMWVGTSGGVIRYDAVADEYRLFDVRSGLLSNGIFHLSKLDGRLAVGTYGGGLSLLDPETETWKHYNIQHGMGDSFVYDMLELPNGDIWIATWSGANRIRGGALDDRASWDLYTVENTAGGLPNDWVYGLAEGKNGEVWMATEGGLARFKDEQWTHWTHAEGLGAPYEQVKDQISFTRDPAKESSHHARQKEEQGLGQVDIAYNPNYIVALLAADDGTVWAGTWGGGLGHFDGERWRNYTMDDGLPANHVFMLHQDADGTVWAGTSKGLAKVTGDGFEVYGTGDGLFAENVFSMATDHHGTRWVGGFGGVARIRGL